MLYYFILLFFGRVNHALSHNLQSVDRRQATCLGDYSVSGFRFEFWPSNCMSQTAVTLPLCSKSMKQAEHYQCLTHVDLKNLCFSFSKMSVIMCKSPMVITRQKLKATEFQLYRHVEAAESLFSVFELSQIIYIHMILPVKIKGNGYRSLFIFRIFLLLWVQLVPYSPSHRRDQN